MQTQVSDEIKTVSLSFNHFNLIKYVICIYLCFIIYLFLNSILNRNKVSKAVNIPLCISIFLLVHLLQFILVMYFNSNAYLLKFIMKYKFKSLILYLSSNDENYFCKSLLKFSYWELFFKVFVDVFPKNNLRNSL